MVSDFDLQSDSALKGGCSELSHGYENGTLSAALVFKVHNDALKLQREVSGFLYEATMGKCNFRMDTKKAQLTPWMRLDMGKDSTVDYHFLTSTSSEAHFDQLLNDINAASGLLALTGVGAGVAIMGNLAGQWAAPQNNPLPVNGKPMPDSKYSDESHTLPQFVEINEQTASLNQSSITVHEIIEGGNTLGSPEPKALGQLNIYPAITTSLLLKANKGSAPDAHDVSLTELWRAPIKTANGDISLEQLLTQIKGNDSGYLQPDWKNYAAVLGSCQRLKRNLKELGFNKFDRNAVLYYFLQQAEDWRNYHQPLTRLAQNTPNANQLQDYYRKNFAECLTPSDILTQRQLNLPVNLEQDWQQILNSRQQQDTRYNGLQAAARQLNSILKNPNSTEIAQQLYPLLASNKSGYGTVLLQNHLGSFGLEAALSLNNLASDGEVISAEQLSKTFALLGIAQMSCIRPAPDQDKLLNQVGIMLFSAKANGNKALSGALELEIAAGKISRISLQLPSTRDFEQHLLEQPQLAGCQIDPKQYQTPATPVTPPPSSPAPASSGN